MFQNKLILFLHILAIIVFVGSRLVFGTAISPTNPAGYILYAQEIFRYILLAAFFYFHYYYLIPKYYFTKQVASYIGLLIVSILSIAIIPNIIAWLIMPKHIVMQNSSKALHSYFANNAIQDVIQEVQKNSYVFFSILFISLIVAISQRLKQTSAEKMETELQFLKAQVNPHFLFNSLNSIYSLSLIKSDKTPTAVLKLSEMMRYVTDESKNEFVSMEKEVKYIDNYIELQNLRMPSTTKLEYRTDIKTSYKQIAPLILIHFVENAFKHGLSATTPSTIQIDIFTTDDELSLYTANPKHNRQKPTQKEDSIGLENTINRLEFLYPNQHTLTINDTPNNYFVTLKMNLI